MSLFLKYNEQLFLDIKSSMEPIELQNDDIIIIVTHKFKFVTPIHSAVNEESPKNVESEPESSPECTAPSIFQAASFFF